MKYAFSNLGCPSWSVEQAADAARELGYEALELRLLGDEVIDPVRDAERVRAAVEACRARGVEVCAFDSSCRFNFAEAEERERNLAELRQWLRLAAELQVPLLRVFGGPDPDGVAAEQANAWVAEALEGAAPQAEAAGVTIALETHDAFSSARRVADVLRRVDSPRVAALWDSHHPYGRGETAEEVLALLGGRLAHVHVKDARRDGPGWQLTLLGEGEVPVAGILTALRRHGYSGYVSVEWEKKWHPEIAEPEVALPQHIRWLREHTEAEGPS